MAGEALVVNANSGGALRWLWRGVVAIIAVDSVTTWFALTHGIGREGNPFQVSLDGLFGVFVGVLIFGAVRLALLRWAYVSAQSTRSRKLYIALVTVLAAFVFLGAPVMVGNLRVIGGRWL